MTANIECSHTIINLIFIGPQAKKIELGGYLYGQLVINCKDT